MSPRARPIVATIARFDGPMEAVHVPPPTSRLDRVPPFVQLLATGVIVAMTGHTVLARGFDYVFAFGGAYRMFLYHLARPWPYVLLVSSVYAALGSWWLRRGPSPSRWRRRLASMVIMIGTIVISAGPGGMIWVYHDMCAGFFPPPERMVAAFWWGFFTGLETAPFIVLSAVPLNVIAIVAGHAMLMRLAARAQG